MFSSRLPAVLAANALSRAAAALRDAGVSLIDFTETNPTTAGISYPPDLLSTLGDPRSARYAPEAFGLEPARLAVAADYRRAGVEIAADHVLLTASTSEAYSMLFKLLCDPGDEVLVPRPSYPLFEWLTTLDAVEARPYLLDYHGVWSIDRDHLLAQITPRTRALLVVSPNNPTGAVTRSGDRDWLAELCAARRLALIADEVFIDYPLKAVALDRHAGEPRVLTFSLGGLSKSAGLPQLKLGWIATSGPDADVEAALDRLALISDTYLSVSTPVQVAAPQLIAAGRVTREAIASRICANLSTLREHLRGHPGVTLLEPDAGWSAVLRIPATIGEESFVLRLLEDEHVLVHPGYFFDFAAEAYLVVSLLPEPQKFAEGTSRLVTLASNLMIW